MSEWTKERIHGERQSFMAATPEERSDMLNEIARLHEERSFAFEALNFWFDQMPDHFQDAAFDSDGGKDFAFGAMIEEYKKALDAIPDDIKETAEWEDEPLYYAIQKLSESYRWIPVEERLPAGEEVVEFVVQPHPESPRSRHRGFLRNISTDGTPGWHSFNSFTGPVTDVTHWRSLPPLPGYDQ